jgi:protein-disulfide isomerase
MFSLTVPVNDRDHILGPLDAPVSVVLYGDYESPDCRNIHQAMEKILGPLLRKVRLVYRHFPLVKMHPYALRAAEAAEAAAAQGKFWEMHALLYQNPAHFKENDLHNHAKVIGLDLERFDAEMASSVYVWNILKDRDLSAINGISEVPTFFVNDRRWVMASSDLVPAVKDYAERSSTVCEPMASH